MGLIDADLELVSAEDMALDTKGYIEKSTIKTENVRALVGSGAYMMCINEHIQKQLDLPFIRKDEAEMADGTISAIDVNPDSKYMARKKLK